jgi:hypothetical protein
VGWYALAKVCELLDVRIFRLSGETVSGHTLKHLFAGMAALWLVIMVRRRRAILGHGPLAPATIESSR